MMPPISFSSSSSAKSGDASSSSGWDASGFSVNFGNGVSQGTAAPANTLLWLAAAVAGYLLWKKSI